jgi:hypothetical protein
MRKRSHSYKRKSDKKSKKPSKKSLKKRVRRNKKVKKIIMLRSVSLPIPTKHKLHGRRHFAMYGKKPS